MKSAIVPAQITTVEDRIAGNLTLQQMVLLAMPIFVDFVLYLILPRSMSLAAYKVVIMVIIDCLCGLSAIRIRGKILLVWATTILRYNSRPRYYVFNKNDTHLRPSAEALAEEPAAAEETAEAEVEHKLPLLDMSTAEVAKLEEILANPAANLHFISRKKGGLHVGITEIE